MNFLVTIKEQAPFFTDYCDVEMFCEDMVVYDLVNQEYSTDGLNWYEIEIDHL